MRGSLVQAGKDLLEGRTTQEPAHGRKRPQVSVPLAPLWTQAGWEVLLFQVAMEARCPCSCCGCDRGACRRPWCSKAAAAGEAGGWAKRAWRSTPES